ncbi:MAG: sulfite exporter TauE/SafE family protein [Ilumatobacteraceae bacterium]
MVWTEFAFAFVTSAIGAIGGLGGAILLVPALVLTGVAPRVAAPLGLVSVAAGSLSLSVPHLRERTVNHRLGIVTEVAATTGAVVGALVSGVVSDSFLTRFLAGVALTAAVLGGRRKGLRNLPDPTLSDTDVGEHVGSLSGAYPLGDEVVPYRARRVPAGLALFGVSGLLAGMAGASGGFIKTPATSEVMHVPVRVAAATTSFTVGLTAAAGLTVMAAQGRLDLHECAAVCVGAVLGGRLGVRLQQRLSPQQVRRFLSGVLVVVGLVLLVRA